MEKGNVIDGATGAVASSGTEPDPPKSLMEAFERDEVAFRAMREELLRDHRNNLVAIRNGELLGSAPTYRELMRDQAILTQRCLIKRVTESEFSPPQNVTFFLS